MEFAPKLVVTSCKQRVDVYSILFIAQLITSLVEVHGTQVEHIVRCNLLKQTEMEAVQQLTIILFFIALLSHNDVVWILRFEGL